MLWTILMGVWGLSIELHPQITLSHNYASREHTLQHVDIIDISTSEAPRSPQLACPRLLIELEKMAKCVEDSPYNAFPLKPGQIRGGIQSPIKDHCFRSCRGMCIKGMPQRIQHFEEGPLVLCF